MDFSLYKDRLIEYALKCGYPVKDNKSMSCFLPNHTGVDKNPSFKIWDSSRFTCFACNVEGDIYDFVREIKGIQNKAEQFKDVESVLGTSSYVPVKKKKETPKRDPEASELVTAYMRTLADNNRDKLIKFAEYRGYGEDFSKMFGFWPGRKQAEKDLGNEVLLKAMIPPKAWNHAGAVVKFKDGWKLFYLKDGKTVKMAALGAKTFPYPTRKHESKYAVLVEAEISSIAGNLNNMNMIATGGVSGINRESAEYLNRYEEIIFCFDADEAGTTNSLNGAEKLFRGGYKGIIKIAEITKESFGNDPDDYIKSGHIEDLKDFIANAYKWKPGQTGLEVDDVKEKDWPFRFLGFSEHFHYFLDRKDMITKAPAGKITSGILLEIAALDFWKSLKMNQQGNPDWPVIIDVVIAISVGTGPYKSESVRGAGIWRDNGHIIASDGENIINGSGRTPVREYQSRNTYIRRAPIGIDSVENKQHEQDFETIDYITKELTFATAQDGQLLFGWIISSIFLSVINWRAIVYMKGPSQVGKSWVMNQIVRRILSGIAVCPKKNSTAIGVMQAPGCDSRMTTIDELETGHDKKSQELVKGLMVMARDATTESPEKRYVGTADQEGISSDFSTMFLFASIVESSDEDQDVNRITAVNFKPKADKSSWPEISSKIMYEFNTGLGDRIRHNAIFHRESVVANIFLFQKVAGSKTKMQRNADQLGTLIAGWYHLQFPGKFATEEEADAYISDFDFTEQEERSKGESMRYILSSILSYKIRYEEEVTISNQYEIKETVKNRERTVFDILQELHKMESNVSRHYLNKALMAYGIRYGTNQNPDKVAIAQGHEGIRKMLPKDFAYKINYHGYFVHHPSYAGKERVVKYMGTPHQVLLFDIDFDDYEDTVPF